MKTASLLALFAFAFSLSAQTKPTRMAWQEFAKDPKRVASFRKGVAVMKSRNSADPSSPAYRTSWEYWGAMHGYFGDKSRFGTKEEWMKKYGYPPDSPYWVGVRNLTPNNPIDSAVWAQCQHGTQYFFPWHRLYLYYFERVLQNAAGDPTLRLPYWDYTDPKNVALPKEFMSPTYVDENGKTVANPLYEKRRATGWDTGRTELDPNDTNINRALDLPDFLGAGQFQGTIEIHPHGDVHCAMSPCKNAVMGAVPYSSNDPIFYLHHCNIDRMWDCWHSVAGHDNPPDGSPYVAQKFSYVDENGSLVTRTVRDIIYGNMVDYVYDHPSDCKRRPAPLLAANVAQAHITTAEQLDQALFAMKAPVVLGETKGVAINALTTTKTVAMPAKPKANSPMAFALTLPAALPLETDLVLKDITFDAPPDTSFNVYLQSKRDPKKRALVGSINFFEGEGLTLPDQTFNVTDVLPALSKAGKLDEVEVIFEATTGRVGANAAPTFNPKAHLVVGTVDLVVHLRE